MTGAAPSATPGGRSPAAPSWARFPTAVDPDSGAPPPRLFCYLHVAARPEDSAPVRRLIAANRGRLARRGVLIPSTMGRVNGVQVCAPLARFALGGADDALDAFAAEIRHSAAHSAILQCDALWRLAPGAQLARLRVWLSLRFRETMPILLLPRHPTPRDQARLQAWREAFGEGYVLARRCAPDAMVRGDAARDFLNAVNLGASGDFANP